MIVIVMLFDSDFGLHYVSLLLRRAAEQDRVSSIEGRHQPLPDSQRFISLSSAFGLTIVLELDLSSGFLAPYSGSAVFFILTLSF